MALHNPSTLPAKPSLVAAAALLTDHRKSPVTRSCHHPCSLSTLSRAANSHTCRPLTARTRPSLSCARLMRCFATRGCAVTSPGGLMFGVLFHTRRSLADVPRTSCWRVALVVLLLVYSSVPGTCCFNVANRRFRQGPYTHDIAPENTSDVTLCSLSRWSPDSSPNRLWIAHSHIFMLAFSRQRYKYQEVRASYNAVRPAGSLAVPPFEEFRGVSDICDHPWCR